MSRYIDTDMLDQVVSDLNSHHIARITRVEYKRISGVLWAFPAADVQEVRHGSWKGKPIAGYSTVRCSVCGAAYTENNGRWSYCPNCGARMDLDDNAIQHTERVENALGALDEVTR